MNFVMANSADRDQIAFSVFPSSRVRLFVMQFQVSRVGPVPFIVGPIAISASIPVATKNFPFDCIRDAPVMFGTLPVRLKQINSNLEVRAARILRYDRPSVFGS